MTFDELFTRWAARPIANCPGRFVLAAPPPTLAPGALVGSDVMLQEFNVSGARDTVVVAALSDGGLISYRRAGGTYRHTLNTPEGFARKLAQLGIVLDSRAVTR